MARGRVARAPKDDREVRYPMGEWLVLMRGLAGDVFPGWLGQPYTYLMGAEANATVFAHDDHFSNREAFAALIPVDGPTSVIVSDGAEHRRRRALVRPALHHKAIEGYVDTMVRTADEAIATITPDVPFDGYQHFRAAIRTSTLRCLFGERLAGRAVAIGEDLQPLIDLTDHFPQTIAMHQRLRTPKWRRAMAARERLDAFVHAEIARVRAEGEGGDDGAQVLATLVHGRDGDGSGLSDLEVRDQAVTLIAAGYETTSAAMAWVLYTLAAHPDVMARARAEVAEVTGGGELTLGHLSRLELVDAVVTETLRLYPPAMMSARTVVRDLEHAGRRIKAGRTLIYSAYVTHRDPELYDDARSFRPDRWIGTGRPSPTAYVPFGGGAHRCIGSELARTELVVMTARLLAKGEWRLAGGPVKAHRYAAMRPKGGLPVTLHPVH